MRQRESWALKSSSGTSGHSDQVWIWKSLHSITPVRRQLEASQLWAEGLAVRRICRFAGYDDGQAACAEVSCTTTWKLPGSGTHIAVTWQSESAQSALP